MPTYVYRREDGSTFEIQQRITEDPLEVCPDTGQKVERVITGAGLIFKGSGFYLTDYARNNGNGEKKTSSETKESTTTAATSESSNSSNGKAESSTSKSD